MCHMLCSLCSRKQKAIAQLSCAIENKTHYQYIIFLTNRAELEALRKKPEQPYKSKFAMVKLAFSDVIQETGNSLNKTRSILFYMLKTYIDEIIRTENIPTNEAHAENMMFLMVVYEQICKMGEQQKIISRADLLALSKNPDVEKFDVHYRVMKLDGNKTNNYFSEMNLPLDRFIDEAKNYGGIWASIWYKSGFKSLRMEE